ncbi:hypothetical protein TNCV_2290171 [Trichonephila clavipes]|uniref:Uncharacterized protein n=1 Tax=Trichonephila clavipes TaxID=2585209 RepID=A0A8X6RJH9_TRICX|nr:hypothetical protein TNCV_2290171 [Trichonephila clavipes]
MKKDFFRSKLAKGFIQSYQSDEAQWSSGASTPQIDHLIETSDHAPQRPMATYTGMGTVGPGPHGLLRH